MSHHWLLFHGFRSQLHLSFMQICQNVGIGIWLSKSKLYLIIIILKLICKSQCVVIEHSPLLRFFFRFIYIRLTILIVLTRWNSDLRHVLLGGTIWCDMVLLIKCFFNPIFLIRVVSRSHDIFFPSLYICFNIIALCWTIYYIFPLITSIFLLFHILFLWLDYNSHWVLFWVVASATRYSRFCEVHYVEGVCFAFYASRSSKKEPLLMPPCISVNLHKQIIVIGISGRSLGLQKVSTFKHWVKKKYVLSILLFQPFLTVIMVD